jgi:uncharacterized protein (TIGR02145 family)
MKIIKLLCVSFVLSSAVSLSLLGCDGDNGAGGGGGGSGSGTFIDSSDGKKYKTVKIGGKTWMAENLNKETSGSWCYENSADSCEKYGRLYEHSAAEHICHSGWRLPNRDDWGALAKAAGGTGDYGKYGPAGNALKSKSGWYNNGNGTDDFGFSALPGGYSSSGGGGFYMAGSRGFWWVQGWLSADYAYNRYMDYNVDYVGVEESWRNRGYSVRCIKD